MSDKRVYLTPEKHVYLDSGLRGWIVNTANANYWRVASWYTLEDLEQDGYLCYTKCWNRYRDLFDVPEPTKDQRKHFMALVQTSYFRYILTLGHQFSLGKDIPISTFQADKIIHEDGSREANNIFDQLLGSVPEQVSIVWTLAKLPTELADALERLVQDGFDGGKYLRKKLNKQTRRKLRETTDQYWERVLGQSNIPDKLAAYLYD